MPNITEYKSARDIALDRMFKIQSEQLEEWVHVLNLETMDMLREFCLRVNAKIMANDKVSIHRVPRGVDLSSVVQNYAMHKNGTGGYGLEQAIRYATYDM